MTKLSQYLDDHKEEFKPWLENNEQGRIDLKILPYLKEVENGFFVEAGALDGLFMSNTKILEDLGWNGLLVEPSLKAYKKCQENRKCLMENCALVSKTYPYDSILGDFFYDGKEGVGAWSSVNRNQYCLTERLVTPARTLDSLFKQHDITHVDILALDVEGYEINVLRGVDFDAVDISYILIEINMLEYSIEDVENILKNYQNLGNISNFSVESNPEWLGLHQDYLFKKI